ncbi:MAG: YIP1 family protein [Bacillota bacterium]
MQSSNAKKFWEIIILGIIFIFISFNVGARLPYNSSTLDSRNEYVKSQDAYIPEDIISNPGGESFNSPSDIFIDEEDKVYIADTWGRRIVVLNSEHELERIVGFGELMVPEGVFVNQEGHIYVADSGRKAVYVFDESGEKIETIERPENDAFDERDSYRPLDVAVDRWNNIYVISEGNPSGLIHLDTEGQFTGYVASNEAQFETRIRFMELIYSREQLHETFMSLVSTPTSVAFGNDRLEIFTLTRGDEQNPIKKFNTSGSQIDLENSKYDSDFVDIFIGPRGNIFTLSQKGTIYVYDEEGNFIFRFGGSSENSKRLGLFTDPAAIAVNSKNEVYVLDENRSDITVFKPTEFTKLIEDAQEYFVDGFYNKSYESWSRVLRRNNMFNLARSELGNSYYRRGQYNQALDAYARAKNKEGYSKAFKEVRRSWLEEHLSLIFTLLFGVMSLIVIFSVLNRKMNMIRKMVDYLQKNKLIGELLYLFRFITHPVSSFYGVKEDKTSNLSAAIYCTLFFLIYYLSIFYTNFIFSSSNLATINPLEEFLKVVAGFIFWVLANYMVSAINEGEGHFSEVFQGTVYALAPYILFTPLLVLLSNGLIQDESFLYYFVDIIILAWSGMLLFFMVLGIHNYDVPTTLKNIFMTLFTMLIMALTVFILYVLFDQLFDFVISVYNEVMIRVRF